MPNAILLISCPDKRGITAAVTNFVYDNNGNIVHVEQHIDDQINTFFMRIEWSLEGFKIKREEITRDFSRIAEKFSMKWDLYFTDVLPKTAIFVSKRLHCLYDLLLRYKEGQLACEIALVVSNHPDAGKVAKEFGISFHEFSITSDNKHEQEKKELEVLKKLGIELVILARYHQILSENFVNEYSDKIINIHHSFLPAFPGKDPYAKAYGKGVKIIGATSHYVTKDLDEGPIIEQGTVRISHKDTLAELIRNGEDLEKLVLSRAVLWHLERKVLRYGNKTVVFD
ncbi:MAG: formyltetrahydrofolate deformylase [Candidatus Omnitrophica bacterium]|nr:formyltetrahydrofolate deformylase [Candidatus Omnitrophota bacterium]